MPINGYLAPPNDEVASGFAVGYFVFPDSPGRREVVNDAMLTVTYGRRYSELNYFMTVVQEFRNNMHRIGFISMDDLLDKLQLIADKIELLHQDIVGVNGINNRMTQIDATIDTVMSSINSATSQIGVLESSVRTELDQIEEEISLLELTSSTTIPQPLDVSVSDVLSRSDRVEIDIGSIDPTAVLKIDLVEDIEILLEVIANASKENVTVAVTGSAFNSDLCSWVMFSLDYVSDYIRYASNIVIPTLTEYIVGAIDGINDVAQGTAVVIESMVRAIVPVVGAILKADLDLFIDDLFNDHYDKVWCAMLSGLGNDDSTVTIISDLKSEMQTHFQASPSKSDLIDVYAVIMFVYLAAARRGMVTQGNIEAVPDKFTGTCV